MQRKEYLGSTSIFYAYDEGVVFKAPMDVWKGNPDWESLNVEKAKALALERQILKRIGKHPRYLGPFCNGILLAEASHGSLQQYLESNGAAIPLEQRWSICEQLAEAFVHIHEKGVIHSDLRPDNVLVHAVDASGPQIWLTDFGGSQCDPLGLDGGHLPDNPFHDPRLGFVSIPATDIFSLGSMFYTILSGHLPFTDGLVIPHEPPEESWEHWNSAEKAFSDGRFPTDLDLNGGEIVESCWQHRFVTAEQVLTAIRDFRKSQLDSKISAASC